jgi:hypothetical protein
LSSEFSSSRLTCSEILSKGSSGIFLRIAPQIRVVAPISQIVRCYIGVMLAVPIRLLPMVVAPISTINQVRKNSKATTRMKKMFL